MGVGFPPKERSGLGLAPQLWVILTSWVSGVYLAGADGAAVGGRGLR